MQALQYMIEQPWAYRALFAGLAVATLCSLLSVIIVLKRMAFIGHGISHAAFGGAGTAALFGLAGLSRDLLVWLFCLGTAYFIGVLSRRRRVEQDTAIGILLVAAMSWGILAQLLSYELLAEPWYRNLIGTAAVQMSIEDVLFGSLLNITPLRMWLAIGFCIGIVLLLAALRRQIIFFTFDEQVSTVFGVRSRLIYFTLLAVMSITIVLTMALAGVILVTALLVIPGAAALQLSRRFGMVVFLSWLFGIAGTVLGLMLCLEIGNVPPGPCIVLMLSALFAGAYVWRGLTRS